MCVFECVEKTFVRFYDFNLFILHVQKFSFSFRCLRAHCATRGSEALVRIMCDKKGICKVPGCTGTPKVMCRKCKVHLCFTSEKKCFSKHME